VQEQEDKLISDISISNWDDLWNSDLATVVGQKHLI
jgi:hypothetical protein